MNSDVLFSKLKLAQISQLYIFVEGPSHLTKISHHTFMSSFIMHIILLKDMDP